MCQLCTLTSIAESNRWPKPLEPLIKDLEDLVDTAHVEAEALRVSSLCSTKEPVIKSEPNVKIELTKENTEQPNKAREAHIQTIRTIQTLFDVLEMGRTDWWNDPKKIAQRRERDEACDDKKLIAMHKINNATLGMIENMRAKVGVYVKWNLGVEDGIEEAE